MNKILALIDADFILWKTVPNKVLSETEQMYGVKSDKTLKETLEAIDWYLTNKIFIPTKATHYIGFLGGKNNFRKSLTDKYKSSRSYNYPKYFNLSKQYLIEEYGFIESNGFEAEDYVAYINSKINKDTPNLFNKVIIVREDHDLDQINGYHFNPSKEEFKTISTLDAYYNFWKSMLTGCSSDNVDGIKGLGDKKASKILDNISKYQDAVLDIYMRYYEGAEGIYQFALNFRQLCILTSENDFLRECGFIPDFPQITEIKHDTEKVKIEF